MKAHRIQSAMQALKHGPTFSVLLRRSGVYALLSVLSALVLALPATVTSVTAPTGSYITGQVVAITVTFNAAVTVTGAPTLTLNLTGSPTATCVPSTNNVAVTCNYTVLAGNSMATLDYANTTALALAGGTIITQDGLSSPATLTLPTPGAAGSLAISAVSVDGVVPTLPVANIVANNVTRPNTITLTFSEAMANNAALTTLATYIVRNNSSAITYSIAAVTRNSATSVTLTMASVDQANTATFLTNADIAGHIKVTLAAGLTDVAGNALAAATITEAGATPVLDTTVPTMTTTFSYLNTTQITLTFSERMNKARAETVSNYAFTGTGGAATYTSSIPTTAVLASNGTSVTLTMWNVNAKTGDTITVTAGTGLTDVAGNALASTAASLTVNVTPTTFSFGTVNNAPKSSPVSSGVVSISGLNAPAYVGLVPGTDSSQLCSVAPAATGVFSAFASCTSPAIVVFNGDQIKIQLTTAANASTIVPGGVVIGSGSGSFSVNTGPAVTIPVGVTFAPVTSAATTISNPDPALYISSNGVLVVPATVGAASMNILGTAPVNTAILVQNNAAAQFNIAGSIVKVQALLGDALFLIKSYTVDSVANVQVLELATGRAIFTGNGSTTPLASLQLGSGSAIKQLLITGTTQTPAVCEIQRNSDGSVMQVGLSAGRVALRLASSASTLLPADVATTMFSNEVATLNAAGKVTALRAGSVSGNANVPGDAYAITLPAGTRLRAKVPNLSLPLERISPTVSLMQGLFDFIGSRATITANTQGAHGQLPLLYNDQPLYMAPYGDVLIDTTRPDGITLANDGRFEVSRNGVYVKLTTTVSNLGLFAQAVATTYSGTIAITEDGGFEINSGGKTTLVRPDLITTPSTVLGFSIVKASNGRLQLQTLGRQQQLNPRFFDLTQIPVTFKSFDAAIALVDNLDGTVTATMKGGPYRLSPEYEILSPIGGIPPERRSDPYWFTSDGIVYFKYPTGAAQGFRLSLTK